MVYAMSRVREKVRENLRALNFTICRKEPPSGMANYAYEKFMLSCYRLSRQNLPIPYVPYTVNYMKSHRFFSTLLLVTYLVDKFSFTFAN